VLTLHPPQSCELSLIDRIQSGRPRFKSPQGSLEFPSIVALPVSYLSHDLITSANENPVWVSRGHWLCQMKRTSKAMPLFTCSTIYINLGTEELSLCTTPWRHVGSGGKAGRSLNLSRLADSCASRQICQSRRYALYRRLGGPHNRSRRYEEENISARTGSRTQICRSASRLVITLTELTRISFLLIFGVDNFIV
jgi:hypothetical protein